MKKSQWKIGKKNTAKEIIAKLIKQVEGFENTMPHTEIIEIVFYIDNQINNSKTPSDKAKLFAHEIVVRWPMNSAQIVNLLKGLDYKTDELTT